MQPEGYSLPTFDTVANAISSLPRRGEGGVSESPMGSAEEGEIKYCRWEVDLVEKSWGCIGLC